MRGVSSLRRSRAASAPFDWRTATSCPEGHVFTRQNRKKRRRHQDGSYYGKMFCQECMRIANTKIGLIKTKERCMTASESERYLDLAAMSEPGMLMPWEREEIRNEMARIKQGVA